MAKNPNFFNNMKPTSQEGKLEMIEEITSSVKYIAKYASLFIAKYASKLGKSQNMAWKSQFLQKCETKLLMRLLYDDRKG